MNLFKIIFFIITSLFINVIFASNLDCLRDKNKQYVNLKQSWLKESKSIFLSVMPEQRNLIELMTKEQLSRIQRRFIAVEFFLSEKNIKENNYKNWIDTKLPVPTWIILSKDQRELLGKRNKKYYEINEKTKKLTKKFSSQDKAPLKELYSIKVRDNKKWLDSISRFNAQTKIINAINCH